MEEGRKKGRLKLAIERGGGDREQVKNRGTEDGWENWERWEASEV